jgi:hypothetical protein
MEVEVAPGVAGPTLLRPVAAAPAERGTGTATGETRRLLPLVLLLPGVLLPNPITDEF